MKIWSAFPFSLPLVAGVLLTLSIATAEGFSIQGAYKYNFDGSMVLQGEGGYSDIVYPGIEVGARLALDLNPLGEATTILLYGFGEYSKTIEETEEASSSAFAKAVLGLGYINSNTLNTLFPRIMISGGAGTRRDLDASMNIMEQDTDMFAQVSVSFDYIPTNRAKLALASRVGLIVVPVLPYLAVEPSYDFESSVFDPTVYAGSLLFISEQAFLGLDIGYSEEKGFVRLFVNYTER